jgi:hypothetical protein
MMCPLRSDLNWAPLMLESKMQQRCRSSPSRTFPTFPRCPVTLSTFPAELTFPTISMFLESPRDLLSPRQQVPWLRVPFLSYPQAYTGRCSILVTASPAEYISLICCRRCGRQDREIHNIDSLRNAAGELHYFASMEIAATKRLHGGAYQAGFIGLSLGPRQHRFAVGREFRRAKWLHGDHFHRARIYNH